ncbi:MAG: hypothetical protein H6Q52_3655 [Deltaproteobacteria bacterium]|nr:hypothetical protein [Deltaproteobacteria bacterium]
MLAGARRTVFRDVICKKARDAFYINIAGRVFFPETQCAARKDVFYSFFTFKYEGKDGVAVPEMFGPAIPECYVERDIGEPPVQGRENALNGVLHYFYPRYLGPASRGTTRKPIFLPCKTASTAGE